METTDRGAIDPAVARRRTLRPLDAVLGVETLHFLLRHLPPPPLRILEVGCGSGEVASLLDRRGYRVVAIDCSEPAVEHARLLGVDARVVCWPDFDRGTEQEPFDAILFTRSLHHISPLEPALQQCHPWLADGGHVLVEDFAFDEMDSATTVWFRSMGVLLHGCDLLSGASDCFGRRLLEDDDAVERWRREHHDLHTAATIRAGLERAFKLQAVERAPYLFRYVAPLVSPGVAGFCALRRFIRSECESINAGELAPIGRRFVAGKG